MRSNVKFLAAAAAVAGSFAVGAVPTTARAADVTLSVQLSPAGGGGTYSVFASITNTLSLTAAPGGQVAGVSSFAIDILGTGGAQVTSRTRRAPAGIADPTDPGTTFGFVVFPSNGTLAGGSVTGLGAGQNTAYVGTNDPAADARVIVGVGLAAGNAGGVAYSNPVLLANGNYTGTAGVITAQLTPGNQFNLLRDTGTAPGFQWSGPGNVESAALVVPGTAAVPEPAAAGLLGLAACGLLARRRPATR